MNQKTILAVGIIVFLVAFPISLDSPFVSAQGALTFSAQDVFQVLQNNGAISFAYNGSYANANFENNTWLFQNLVVNNYTMSNIPFWCLAISTQNSNVTITGYSAGALTGLAHTAAWLNYTVIGNGTQMVNLDYGYTNGLANQFSVYVDGTNRTQGDGWTVSSDLSLTISGAIANVSVYYPPNIPPSTTPTSEGTSIPEFPIATVVIVAVSVIASAMILLAIRLKKTLN